MLFTSRAMSPFRAERSSRSLLTSSATSSAAAFVCESVTIVLLSPMLRPSSQITRSDRRAAAPHEAGDKRDEKQDEEDVEQDLRDTACRCGDAAKAESGGDESDDEEYGRPIKHCCL